MQETFDEHFVMNKTDASFSDSLDMCKLVEDYVQTNLYDMKFLQVN